MKNWGSKRLVVVVFSLLFISTAVLAVEFEVEEFVIDGDNPLNSRQTESALKDFQGVKSDINKLNNAAKSLEQLLAKKGFDFYRVVLPPQELTGGKVRLQVKSLKVGKISAIGNEYFSDKNVIASLPILTSGMTPSAKRIAKALALVNENPAKTTRVVFVRGENSETMDAQITVKDRNPQEFFIWGNNNGSELSTKSRLGVQYNHRNLWGKDHQLSLSYTLSPEDTSKIRQYGFNYRAPLYRYGGSVNLFVSKSNAETGRVAEVFDVSGSGDTAGLGYTQTLNKIGNYRHKLGVSIIDKLFDNRVDFAGEDIGRDIRSRPLSLNYQAEWVKDKFSSLVNLIYTQNLSGGSFNDDESYALSRLAADSDWNKQNLALRLNYQLAKKWATHFSFDAQKTSDLLIAGEKFGFGGAFAPRGFLEREVTVDEGYKTSLELWRSLPLQNVQLGAFYDYANGSQNDVQAGEVADETLSSVGLGLKWNWKKQLYFDVNYGYVLDGVSEIVEGATRDSDNRVHLAFRYRPQWGL